MGGRRRRKLADTEDDILVRILASKLGVREIDNMIYKPGLPPKSTASPMAVLQVAHVQEYFLVASFSCRCSSANSLGTNPSVHQSIPRYQCNIIKADGK